MYTGQNMTGEGNRCKVTSFSCFFVIFNRELNEDHNLHAINKEV